MFWAILLAALGKQRGNFRDNESLGRHIFLVEWKPSGELVTFDRYVEGRSQCLGTESYLIRSHLHTHAH